MTRRFIAVAVFGVLFGGAVLTVEAQRSATPRTPWGDPDLQGVWTSEAELNTPFERPSQFGERQFLTDVEFTQRQAQAGRQIDSDNAEFDVSTADTRNAGAVGSATSPPPHWLERGKVSRRTSLVIDPPDGRVPAMTADARSRAARPQGTFGANGAFNTGAIFNGPEDLSLWERCISRGLPGAIFPTVYNANTRIVQGPGFVAITYEMIHDTRVIPTDGRAHAGASVRSYFGDSVGRWDGDTLVVDSTGFVPYTWFDRAGNYHSDALHVVERYTPVSPYHLMYEATIEDPKVFTRPWKMSFPLYRRMEKNVQLLDFNCVEFVEEMLYGRFRKPSTK